MAIGCDAAKKKALGARIRSVVVTLGAVVAPYVAGLAKAQAATAGFARSAQTLDRLTEAAFTAVVNGRRLVADLNALRADWQTRVRARKGTAVWRVADMLLRHPVINANLVSKELGIATPNVYRTIKPLIDAGILTVSHAARRDRVWRSAEVLAAADASAARAGRRAQPI